MRFFIVTYYRRANQQMDEAVSVATRVRSKDIDSASVILDFANKSVIKCSLGDKVGMRDWSVVRDYFHQHYQEVIDQLEKNHQHDTIDTD